MQVKASKDFIVPLFRDGKKWAGPSKELDDDEWGGWRVRSEKYKLGNTEMEVRKTGKLLGKLYGMSPERHPMQIEMARNKAAKSARMVAAMGANAEKADTKLAHFLYTFLVESVLVTHTVHTQLNDQDWLVVRRIQAKLLRRASRAGQRVPIHIIIKEHGWSLVDKAIVQSKLSLHESIKGLERREYAKTINEERMATVREGRTKKGLCYETKTFWDEAKRGDQWEWTVVLRRTEGRKKFRREIACKVAQQRLRLMLVENDGETEDILLESQQEEWGEKSIWIGAPRTSRR